MLAGHTDRIAWAELVCVVVLIIVVLLVRLKPPGQLASPSRVAAGEFLFDLFFGVLQLRVAQSRVHSTSTQSFGPQHGLQKRAAQIDR